MAHPIQLRTIAFDNKPVSNRNLRVPSSMAATAAASSSTTNESVRVAVRCRPFSQHEKQRGCHKIIQVDKENFQISIIKPINPELGEVEEEPKRFTFDAVFDEQSTQREVYDETAFSLIENVMAGYNGTIFAYGQTGCGKTYTMEGRPDPSDQQGIIPTAIHQVFDTIAANTVANKRFLVTAAYIEIYNEEIRDLLGQDPTMKLQLKEDKERGLFVKGLSQIVVKDVARVKDLMKKGNSHRTTGFTEMNADSSRSHSIFILNIETSEPDETTHKERIRAGKLNLVDLAGSERQSKTKAEGVRLLEATKINLSLTALGKVISALVSGKEKHIPYRESKLTRLLQDSLGGNTKTIMIAAVSPADYNYEETLSTLRYANRAKDIKNKPKINEDPKVLSLLFFNSKSQLHLGLFCSFSLFPFSGFQSLLTFELQFRLLQFILKLPLVRLLSLHLFMTSKQLYCCCAEQMEIRVCMFSVSAHAYEILI